MNEQIDLLVEEPDRDTPGLRISAPVLVSLVVHALLVIFLVLAYHPIKSDDKPVPIARYVELIKQNPKDFVEAPGRKVDTAKLNAPYSDANRRAAMPKPTGDQPTIRPGNGAPIYTPPSQPSVPGPRSSVAQPATPSEDRGPRTEDTSSQVPPDLANNSSSRMPALRTTQASAGEVNWNHVIKEVGKVATLGGNQGLDLDKLGGGGDRGFTAENGPLSFETQWYDWGAYAASMVGKIRINWYDNMPPLIRTGMKGVVTIRFTIQRDGRITDVTILNGSGIPPYDFAAKKAIELSSPLNPLPKDFPNPNERVTCMFFYNSEPPSR